MPLRRSKFPRLLCVLLALPSLAGAQLSTVEDHLRRGVELRRAGQDEESLAEFEAAYGMAQEPRTAAQLGLARQAVGRWLDADRLLREALTSPSDPWVTRNRGALDAALEVVSGHIGEVDVRCNVPGAAVRVLAATVATLPLTAPVRVLAGMISLEVVAEGYETVSRRFVVEPRTLVRELVELRPVAPRVVAVTPPIAAVTPPTRVPPSEVVPPRVGGSALRWWGAASFVGAGVALTVGFVALGLREDLASQYNSQTPGCPPPPAHPGTHCADLEDTAGRWGTTAWIALPVGAALAATGVLLLALPTRRAPRAAWFCAPFATGRGIACGAVF